LAYLLALFAGFTFISLVTASSKETVMGGTRVESLSAARFFRAYSRSAPRPNRNSLGSQRCVLLFEIPIKSSSPTLNDLAQKAALQICTKSMSIKACDGHREAKQPPHAAASARWPKHRRDRS
jgi:hypothetical protein